MWGIIGIMKLEMACQPLRARLTGRKDLIWLIIGSLKYILGEKTPEIYFRRWRDTRMSFEMEFRGILIRLAECQIDFNAWMDWWTVHSEEVKKIVSPGDYSRLNCAPSSYGPNTFMLKCQSGAERYLTKMGVSFHTSDIYSAGAEEEHRLYHKKIESFGINTDFSLLDALQSHNWMRGVDEMVENAFQESSSHCRLLGNMLILEQYTNTLRHGLSVEGKKPSAVLQHSIDLLWGYLENSLELKDFESFANNLYAVTLAYEVGEDLTAPQKVFDDEYFGDKKLNSIEWQLLNWTSMLLMELVANLGGRIDIDSFENRKEIDFYGVSEMLNLLEDAYIDFTNTPLPSSKATDLSAALSQVYQTPLFRQLIGKILTCLKAALVAAPDQYSALRQEFMNDTIIPKELSKNLMEF